MTLIYKKIIEVMKSIDAVEKSRKNTGQNYSFRGIDDLYNELHNRFAEHGIFTAPEVLEERTEERTTSKGTVLIYRILKMKYTFFAEDGSNVVTTVIGEGMDSGDKSANKAMSAAHKYALMQVFAIPTEDAKDSEQDSHSIAPRTIPTIFFESSNPRHLGWLELQLNERSVSADKHEAIAKAIHGFNRKAFDEFLIAKGQKPTRGWVE